VVVGSRSAATVVSRQPRLDNSSVRECHSEMGLWQHRRSLSVSRRDGGLGDLYSTGCRRERSALSRLASSLVPLSGGAALQAESTTKENDEELPDLAPLLIGDPFLTQDLDLGSLTSFQNQESLTLTFDAPPADNRASEVDDDALGTEIPSEASLTW
jgi:hypothetical protein